MWTRKGGLLVFLGIISIFTGLISGDFQFMVLALIVFTFFLLVLTLPRPEVTINRVNSNPLLFENNEVNVQLNLNKVQGGFGTVEVFDRIPEFSELNRGLNNMVYNPRNQAELHYRVKFPLRGYYSIGPTKVRVADHFNIFYTDQTMGEKEPVSIFPHVAGLKDFKLRSRKNIYFPGDFLTPQAGSSTEFYNIRDYLKTDPFKKINWKVYARKRELMVNEYEKENICDTMIFLDARSITNIGSIKENTLESNIKLALAIANFLILHRNQVGMVVYNDEVKVMPPKPGLKQRNDILRFLTGVYARGWIGLDGAFYYARAYIKSKTTIVILSNLDYDHSLYTEVQNLVGFNNRILIITPSSIDFELKAAGYSGPLEKVHLFKLSRQNYITELRSLGVDVVEYTTEDTVEDILDKISFELLR